MATFYTYKNKKGEKRYKFKVYLGTDAVTGKRVETTRQGFESKKEAQRACNKLQLEFDSKNWHKDDSRTINSVFDEWFKNYKNTVKPSTARLRLSVYNAKFRKQIGDILINKITPSFLQDLVNEASLKKASYKKDFNVLEIVFKYAFKHRLILENPFEFITYPKSNVKKHTTGRVKFLTKEQLLDFLDDIKFDQEAYTLCRLLAFSGMRIKEALALTSDDIEGNVIHVTKNLYLNSDNEVCVGSPKTKNSVRDIVIDDETLLILNKWRMKCGCNIIFPNVFGKYQKQPHIYTFFKNYYREHPNAIRISPHTLRHTHASLLFESGASMKDVQVRLGHADINTTMNIYTHITKPKLNDTVSNFAKFMNQ